MENNMIFGARDHVIDLPQFGKCPIPPGLKDRARFDRIGMEK
jgi:hypothetical protein